MAAEPENELKRQNAYGLIEEAYVLLRTTPVATHAVYFIGTVPWVLGVVFFCSAMAFDPRGGELVTGGALGLTGLYFWMKIWQAAYARALYNRLAPDGGAGLSAGGWVTWRRVAALVFVQALSMPVHVLAGVLTLPIGWTIAFFQNASVLGLSRDFGKGTLRGLLLRSAALSHHRALENHMLLLVLLVFSVGVWIGIYSLFLAIPSLAKMFMGIDSVFTTNSFAAIGNTTTVAVSLGLTLLAVGPLIKAVYVLRCFYAIAEKTGDDLLGRLRSATLKRGSPVVALVVGVWLVVGVGETAGQEGEVVVAAESAAGGGAEAGAELGRAIEGVLSEPLYEWRLPPLVDAGGDVVGESLVGKFFTRVGDALRDAMGYVGDTVEKLAKGVFGSGGGGGAKGGVGGAITGADVLKAVVWLALIVMVVWLAWVMIAGRLKRRGAVAVDGDSGAGAIDLESEDVFAGSLEEDEWLVLAREKVDAGEFRLAIRALFLACLTTLSERKLVRLERSKSNRDYQRELELRGRGEVGVGDEFLASSIEFEATWYGDHEAGPAQVESLRGRFEKLKGGRG